jgi:hypothetical protein
MPSGHPMDKYAKEVIVNIYKWLIEEGPNQFNTSSLEEGGIYLKIAKMTKLDQKPISKIIREYYANNGRLSDSNISRPGRRKIYNAQPDISDEKLRNLQPLVHEAFEKIVEKDPQIWRKCVGHVKKIEVEYFEKYANCTAELPADGDPRYLCCQLRD